MWIQSTGQNIRHFYYLLIKESAGAGYTAALGPAYFVHRFYKHNVLLYIGLRNVDNCFIIMVCSHLIIQFNLKAATKKRILQLY